MRLVDGQRGILSETKRPLWWAMKTNVEEKRCDTKSARYVCEENCYEGDDVECGKKL